MLHRSRNSGREFTGWNQLPCGPVLTPNISCTKLEIHSVHADSPIVPKHLLNLMSANLDVGPVYASQITKLRKRICKVEPAPLWTSSCTQYLLYKDQDPNSSWRQSKSQNDFHNNLFWTLVGNQLCVPNCTFKMEHYLSFVLESCSRLTRKSFKFSLPPNILINFSKQINHCSLRS